MICEAGEAFDRRYALLTHGFHFAFDYMQLFVIGTPNGAQFPAGRLLDVSFDGPAWLTGGVLGTEASFLMSILNDALSYDIFSQAAQAVKEPVRIDPMGSLHVEGVFACGGSSSADFLVIYHDSIHPLAGVFDGFFVAIGGGLLRGDLDVKVFKVLRDRYHAPTLHYTGRRVSSMIL